jgi:hypothetical protein
MAWLFETETVKEYQRYRKTGRNLNHKIIDAYLNETILEKAATMLRLGQKRRLILDSEDDLSVLMDFALYEIPHGDGKNSVEHYAEEKGGVNAIERELLAAMVKAQTGLFKVKRVLRDKRQIVLENLINPESGVILTDINFSQTLIEGLVVFFRPIRMAKFTMTSGIAFVFPAGLEQELARRWKSLEVKGSAERYAWFFRESKQSGLETVYV